MDGYNFDENSRKSSLKNAEESEGKKIETGKRRYSFLEKLKDVVAQLVGKRKDEEKIAEIRKDLNRN